MGFRENINRICAERGTYLSHVVRQVKGSASFTTNINNGSIPKESEMEAMAKVLGCSVADFFRDTSDNPQVACEEPADDDERDLLNIYRSLPRREKHEFMSRAYDYEKRQGK